MGSNEFNFNILNLIRWASRGSLCSRSYLEAAILGMGLNDRHIHQFPKHLHPFCGKGVKIWQNPVQFTRYLIALRVYNIRSYLEIGTCHGGTFITTVEYLSMFNKMEKAIGIDIKPSKILEDYLPISAAQEASYSTMDSTSDSFPEMINREGPFDLVLVDGFHSYGTCLSDWNNVREHARCVAFHDIDNDACPDVVRVWKELKDKHRDEYYFYEFTQQYSGDENYFGIGLMIKKNG